MQHSIAHRDGKMAEKRPRMRIWRQADLTYQTRPDLTYGAKKGGGFFYSRIVDTPVSERCRAGYAKFQGSEIVYEQRADEVIFVLAGTMSASDGEHAYSLEPGDVLFVPRGTQVVMSGQKDSKIAYVWQVPDAENEVRSMPDETPAAPGSRSVDARTPEAH